MMSACGVLFTVFLVLGQFTGMMAFGVDTWTVGVEKVSNGLKIRINSLAPGVFPSEMTTEGSDQDQKSHIPAEKYAEKVPARRPGRDEDMAQAVLFFAANQYLNGQNVAVDGGYTLAAGL